MFSRGPSQSRPNSADIKNWIKIRIKNIAKHAQLDTGIVHHHKKGVSVHKQFAFLIWFELCTKFYCPKLIYFTSNVSVLEISIDGSCFGFLRDVLHILLINRIFMTCILIIKCVAQARVPERTGKKTQFQVKQTLHCNFMHQHTWCVCNLNV